MTVIITMIQKNITVKDLSSYLGIHPNTIYKWIKKGGIPYTKINGQIRFKKEDIEEWFTQVISKWYQKIKDSMSEEEKAGISPHKFIIYKMMQEYRVDNKKRKFIKGESHYDCEAAYEENGLVRWFYNEKTYGSKKRAKNALSDMLREIKDQIEDKDECRYIPILEPRNHLKGYVRARETFGNIKGKTGFNKLWNEIEDLILEEERFEDCSRGLQRKYHLYKIGDDKKGNIEKIKELWDSISKDYERMKPEEIKFLREFYKGPVRRAKEKKEAWGREITPEEYKERYEAFKYRKRITKS